MISRMMLAGAATAIALFYGNPAAAQATAQSTACDPYKDYSCLDTYLGDNVFERFFNYYRLEWGEAAAPSAPNSPSAERDGWPQTPQTTPPMA